MWLHYFRNDSQPTRWRQRGPWWAPWVWGRLSSAQLGKMPNSRTVSPTSCPVMWSFFSSLSECVHSLLPTLSSFIMFLSSPYTQSKTFHGKTYIPAQKDPGNVYTPMHLNNPPSPNTEQLNSFGIHFLRTEFSTILSWVFLSKHLASQTWIKE